jgi:hypothetical protein
MNFIDVSYLKFLLHRFIEKKTLKFGFFSELN